LNVHEYVKWAGYVDLEGVNIEARYDRKFEVGKLTSIVDRSTCEPLDSTHEIYETARQ